MGKITAYFAVNISYNYLNLYYCPLSYTAICRLHFLDTRNYIYCYFLLILIIPIIKSPNNKKLTKQSEYS